MNKYLNIKYLLLVFLITQIDSNGQTQFEHIGIENGLSNNSVRQIIQDKEGFLWFGTLNGLNRFDGKQIRSYSVEAKSKLNQNSLRVNKLYEDSFNYLWVSTFENQILRFDSRSEQFLTLGNFIQKAHNLSESFKLMQETSSGVIWISARGTGLIRIIEEMENNLFQVDLFDTLQILSESDIYFVFHDKNKTTWIGTGNGLLHLSNDKAPLSSMVIETIPEIDAHISFTCVNEISEGILFGTKENGLFIYKNGELSKYNTRLEITKPIQNIFITRKNALIVTTNGQGFYYLDPLQNNWHQFKKKSNRNTNLDNQYFKVYEDKHGIIWLISSKRGITAFNAENLTVRHYGLEPDFRESPGETDKQTILDDSNGDLWIGIYGGGLFKYNRKKQDFDHFYYSKSDPYGLSSNFVLDLYEDASQNLWVSTFEGGINKLSLWQNNFKYTEPVKNAQFKSENEVRSLLEDTYERLWVGTKNGEIFCYNKNNELIFKIPEDLKYTNHQYVKCNVYSLLEDKKGNLWIGTKGEGLLKIEGILASKNLNNKSFKIDLFVHNENDSASLSNNNVYTLYQDHLGQIWIGTYFGGIDIIENPDNQTTFIHYINELNNPKSLSDNKVRCFFQDKDDNMWIGTTYGLNFLESQYINIRNKTFVKYFVNRTQENTLINNEILDIQQDKSGNIWFSSFGNGLTQLITDSVKPENSFVHYLKSNGLPSNVIFSILEDPGKNFWLATDNGLCKFSLDGSSIEKYTSKEGTGDDFYSEGACLKTRNGDFVYGQKSGFVRFNPELIRRDTHYYPLVLTDLKIFDESIVPGAKGSPLIQSIENTHKINLRHYQNFISIEFSVLDFKSPDKVQYSFVLEGLEEKWNYVANQNKAVYRGLSPGEYSFKVKATNSNGIWMDQIKELKINISPPVWKTKAAYLVYSILIILLVWIITYFITKEIRMKNEINYEKRLTEDKLMFYTNISHEFKTPLTLINNSTDDLLEASPLSETISNKIKLIKKNSMRLQNLIEQLMDFRRIQKGKMELKTNRLDIVAFIEEIYNSFTSYASKKNIDFILQTNLKRFECWFDPKHVEKIVVNLLSNAFKHTPENRKIIIKILIDNTNEFLSLEIIDEGIGIEPENLEKIFDRFAFIDKDIYSQYKGSGIGLALVCDLVNLHKGKISVESTLNKGSNFKVTLPVGRNDYLEEEREENITQDMLQPIIQSNIEDLENEEQSSASVLHSQTSSAIKSQLLIVEDDDELRTYMADKLKKNFNVFAAKDGKDALQIANKLNPDLIVSDIKMPRMDGLELMKEIKRDFNTSHIPIILLTAKSSIEHKIEGLDFGADDYITKPFNMTYLQKRIENIINQRKILKEKFSMDPGFKPDKLAISGNDQKFLSEVTHLVEENLKTLDFSIENIIEQMGYSRTIFYKKMKGILGYAPKEFIRTIKMKNAATLLREPGASVAQVSYEIGYNDPDYFSKSFKNYFGETPSDYQKKFR